MNKALCIGAILASSLTATTFASTVSGGSSVDPNSKLPAGTIVMYSSQIDQNFKSPAVFSATGTVFSAVNSASLTGASLRIDVKELSGMADAQRKEYIRGKFEEYIRGKFDVDSNEWGFSAGTIVILSS